MTSAPGTRIARLRRVAVILDGGAFPLDPILGLIPGFGDAAGAVLAIWILVEGFGLGASRATLLRIALNIGIDALVGTIPVVGDIFDFAWKANLKNVALLERQHLDPVGARRADRMFVGALAGGLVVLCGSLAVAGAWLVARLIHLLTS